jgi:glyoxylase-like metal-dependent hydrolase (beta-lactamase superfamily II)
MQILPNVYLVNGFPYGQHQNAYVVRAGDVRGRPVRVMVDSGDLETDTFGLVQRNCSLWGIGLEQISHMLVTHAHFDHSSHAARLQQMGAIIVANEDCADAMATGDDRCIGYAVHRSYTPCRVDRVVSDGAQLQIGGAQVRCIAAPGHAQSCMVYEVMLESRRLWFVGDVILTEPECQGVRLGWNGGPDYDRATYLKTLRELAHLECDCLLPGHGPPCIGNAKRLVEMAYTKALMEWR